MTTIAIIGLTGNLGKPVLEAALSSTYADKIKFPIKAISRSAHESTEQIEYIQADLSETDKIAGQLAGTDVIIELTAPNPTVFESIEKIVAQVKPKLFIPSQFGFDIAEVQKFAPGFLNAKQVHSAAVRKSGTKVVDIVTGYFAVPGSFLYEIVQLVGINPQDKTYEVRGGLDTKVSYSTFPDVGRAVIGVATYGDYSKLPDLFRFQSGEITVGEIVKDYEAKHSVTLTKTREITKEEALTEFQAQLAAGFDGSKFLSYLYSIASQGVDHGANFSKTNNDLINEDEKVWKYTLY